MKTDETTSELFEALNGLYALIENHDLVRNTDNDDDFRAFSYQSLKIVAAIEQAKMALDNYGR
jgi:hypothetical protein